MRGTGYAIIEIILWMLVAGLIGVAIGWVLRSTFGGGARLEESEAKLEKEKARYSSISSELGDWKRKVEGLESEVESGSAELSKAKELNAQLEEDLSDARAEASGMGSKLDELESDLEESRADLEKAVNRVRELEGRVTSVATEEEAEIQRLGGEITGLAALQSAVADRESQIAALDAQLSDLRSEYAACRVAREEAAGRIAGLEAAIAERDERIDRMSAELPPAPMLDEAASDLEPSGAAETEPPAKPAQLSWSHGSTVLGTPGDDHRDDLKVINGVGPKLEATLNEYGIQSWEQLAALTPDEVARVDEALEEFPGRIQRDEWVSQAADLVARFPDRTNRPGRTTYLNEEPD